MADPLDLPEQSPLFHAQHAARYDRQQLIGAYEERYDCRLAVMLDAIFPASVAPFEELIYNADPDQDLHLVLFSPGGDGETAVRLVRSAQARCRELTVIVPDQAKSAGTVLAMGAHHILMGPTSDLGPVDPQFQLPGGLSSAKDIIAAVENAEERIQAAPETYPLYVALLSDVSGLMVQQARSALERSSDLVEEALASNPDRAGDETDEIKSRVREKLIDLPVSHAAIFGAAAAKEAGLPVEVVDPRGEQWQIIWRLWNKYIALGAWPVYEGVKASQIGTAFTPTTTNA
ncbi:MAG: serine dehydrogenase [Actinomycetota bacterium]|nr:serine dehydrogenase [Actinomycetota bacterium]